MGPLAARRRIAVALSITVLAGTVLVPNTPRSAEAATATPVMRSVRTTPAQMAGWFHANTPGGYRAGVPVEWLAAYFAFEGEAEGVSGDIAFAQSVLETGWFTFPSDKQVTPSHNNFGGIGACDGGTCTVARFPSARIGVRAQIQHLRAYADPTVTADRLAYPLVDPRFDLVVPKGKAPNWEDLGGNWASDREYGAKVLALYRSMRSYAAAHPELTGYWLFSDVPEGSRFEHDILAIAVEGITQGCGGGRYCPKASVTRDQMASFLVRSLGLKLTNKQYFVDIAGNSHRRSINTLREHGITLGCNAPRSDRYCPSKPVTRGEMASFLARAKGLEPVSRDRFSDIASSTHRRNINAIAAAGITRGCGGTRYCPKDEVTREQMAALLNRAFLPR